MAAPDPRRRRRNRYWREPGLNGTAAGSSFTAPIFTPASRDHGLDLLSLIERRVDNIRGTVFSVGQIDGRDTLGRPLPMFGIGPLSTAIVRLL